MLWCLFLLFKVLLYLCCKLSTYIWYIIINVYYLEASKISFFFLFFFFSCSSTVKKERGMCTLDALWGARLYYNLFLIGKLKKKCSDIHESRNRLSPLNSLLLLLYMYMIRSTYFFRSYTNCLFSLPPIALHSFLPSIICVHIYSIYIHTQAIVLISSSSSSSFFLLLAKNKTISFGKSR